MFKPFVEDTVSLISCQTCVFVTLRVSIRYFIAKFFNDMHLLCVCEMEVLNIKDEKNGSLKNLLLLGKL